MIMDYSLGSELDELEQMINALEFVSDASGSNVVSYEGLSELLRIISSNMRIHLIKCQDINSEISRKLKGSKNERDC